MDFPIESIKADFWNNPLFDHFWQHYRHSQQWCEKNWAAVARGRLEEELPANTSFSQSRERDLTDIIILPPPPPPPPHHFYRQRVSRIRRGRRYRRKKFTNSVQFQDADRETGADLAEEHADFIEFLSHSIKHRAERDQAKAQPASWSYAFDEFTPIDKVGINRRPISFSDSLKPPTIDLAELRNEKMRRLYGSNAEKIFAMETLMQVEFDADFDKYNPPLWPNMPLRL